MADPLSIAASIAGLISITVETAKFLAPYVSAAKETPQIAAHVFSEVQSIEVILQGLQSLTANFASIKAQHAALIGVSQVVTILTDGVLLFSELQNELDSLPAKDEADEGVSLWSRLQWARKESSLNALIVRLQSFKSSTTLILMILKSDSDRLAAVHQEELSNNIKALLDTNHSLSQRLMGVEDALEAQTIRTNCNSLLTLPGRHDPSDLAYTPLSSTGTDIDSNLLKFDFEDDLESSRVYRRTKRDTVDFSFCSSILRSNSWSVFSGLSLSDVSCLSVIALPVYSDDIINAHHYNFGETASIAPSIGGFSTEHTYAWRDVPRLWENEPLLSECHDLKLKMLQLPRMAIFFENISTPLDPFHHLWEVFRQASPLIVLVQALNPRIGVPDVQLSPIEGRRVSTNTSCGISTRDKNKITMWFILYCHLELSIPVDSLFTISDLMFGDCYGFFKVLPVMSLIIEKLKVKGIVRDYYPLLSMRHMEYPQMIMDFMSSQRKAVQDIDKFAKIMHNISSYPKPEGDRDFMTTLDLAARIAAKHINLLTKMEKNLFLPVSEHRWAPVFELYLKDIDLEILLITKELTKLRSFLSSGLSTSEDRSETLSECLTLLQLIANRDSAYGLFLNEIQPASPDQENDMTDARVVIEQACLKIEEGFIKDLNQRVMNWKGLSPLGFGKLLLHTTVTVAYDANKPQLETYLFEGALLFCSEVHGDPQKAHGVLNGGPSRKIAAKQRPGELVPIERLFLRDILEVNTMTENGNVTADKKMLHVLTHELIESYICEVRSRLDGSSELWPFCMEFAMESKMRLWASRIEEQKRRVTVTDNVE
ncbi:unnamed protein product [Fusarium graminearum]|uniref:Uncharacterized protein n=1 Tax=Gibberella zeae TaxID=5518 RepID=A0A4U9EZ87_GIBZA|nr:unnamed protein product [Fusarium graminearum]CZS77257.1 unnamed protein product [Fusarium graminearum]VTO87683.1 unnamed protein product [Fusarium graminearum]